MRWALSRVTTRRSWLISFTVRVFGTSTSIPDGRICAVIMKMISNTRTTSTNGTMLISESEVCVDLESGGVFLIRYMRPGRTGAPLIKHLLHLRGYFQRKSVQPLREIPNILQKLIVEDNRRNRRRKARRGGHKGLRDAGRHRAKAGGSGAAKTRERIDNPPHSSKETDEWRYRSGGSQPRHAFFDATHLVGRSDLHAHGHGLQTFQFGWMRVTRDAPHLALQFAITRRVHRGEG